MAAAAACLARRLARPRVAAGAASRLPRLPAPRASKRPGRAFCAAGGGAAHAAAPAVEVVRGGTGEAGALVRGALADGRGGELRRGLQFEHGGQQWVTLFQLDRFWFASPAGGEGQPTAGEAAAWLQRPTPTQAERLPLAEGLSTGVVALDVLAPIGEGQSMLIFGAPGSGKTTLARDIAERALASGRFDRVLRFSTGPGAPPPIDAPPQAAGALTELVARPPPGCSEAAGLASLALPAHSALAAAEAVRDAGGRALLVVDTVAPLLDAWDLAARWAECALGAPLDAEQAASHRRNFFAGVFERAANLSRGGSLTLIALVEGGAPSAAEEAAALQGGAPARVAAYGLADFAGRRASELERLRRLADRGLPLTAETLGRLGIAPPGQADGAPDTPGGGGAAARADASRATFRELQSLSDGQVELDLEAARAGRFPAVVPGASFSRFGLGSNWGGAPDEVPSTAEIASHVSTQHQRSCRHPALQAVAAHLRVQLALERDARFRPGSAAVADGEQSARMEAVRAAMLQPPRSPLRPEEMVAVLLAACGGALGGLPPDQAARALSGGSVAPLVVHLREAAPRVLSAIASEGQLSTATARELEVALRLFVALDAAGGPTAAHAAGGCGA